MIAQAIRHFVNLPSLKGVKF